MRIGRIKNLQSSPWLLRKVFDEVEDLVETSRSWDVDFRQLRPGRFVGSLEQAVGRGVLLSVGRFSRALDQAGSPPAGMRTFAVPMSPELRYHWRGHEIHGGQVAAFPVGGELRAVSRPGFHVATVSLTEDRFDDLLRARGVDFPDSAEVFTPRPPALERLRQGLRRHMSHLTPEGLNEELPKLLLSTLIGPGERRGAAPPSRRDRALRRVSEYLATVPTEPVTVRDLCAVTEVSHRTLAYAFRERYGTTAKAWLRDRRLTDVWRELRRSDPATTKVTDVANRWGFWHLGQFAADYRRRFGELPSTTIARPARG